MFAECTIQYDTKNGWDIYVFVEKQILVFPYRVSLFSEMRKKNKKKKNNFIRVTSPDSASP